MWKCCASVGLQLELAAQHSHGDWSDDEALSESQQQQDETPHWEFQVCVETT